MIDTLYLAKYLQEEFNNNAYGKKFAIYADEGDLKKSAGVGKYKKDWTSGVLQIVSDNFVNLKDLEFQTLNTSLFLMVDLQACGWTGETETTRKQSKNLIGVKNVINEIILRINGIPHYIEVDGKMYNMTVAMSKAVTGDKTALGEINDGIPLYISIQFNVFENGVNSNDIDIAINDEYIGYTQATITMLSQFDQSEFAGSSSKSYPLVTGSSFDLVVPLLNLGITQELLRCIMNKYSNKAWLFTVKVLDSEYNYICNLVKGTVTMTSGINTGLNISMVEACENASIFERNKWTVTDRENYSASEVNIGDVIFWGDGTENRIRFNDDKFHFYIDDTNYKIIIYRGANNEI